MVEHKARFDFGESSLVSYSKLVDMFLRTIPTKKRKYEQIFHKVGEGHDNISFDFTLFGRYDQGEIAEVDLQHLMPDFLSAIKPYRKIGRDTYKLEEHISVGENIVAWDNEPIYRVNIKDNMSEFVCSTAIQPYKGGESFNYNLDFEKRVIDLGVKVQSWNGSKGEEFRKMWYKILKDYEKKGIKRLE